MNHLNLPNISIALGILALVLAMTVGGEMVQGEKGGYYLVAGAVLIGAGVIAASINRKGGR